MTNTITRVFTILSIILFFSCTVRDSSSIDLGEIAKKHKKNADLIINRAIADSQGYNRLGEMLDTFGPRLSGSSNLEKTLEWIIDEMNEDELENVHGEDVMVPKWVRGKESATMTSPWMKNLAILGLGGSVGTGPKGLSGEVFVVTSFDDLKSRAGEAKGKIVLYNVPFTTYGETVQYRYRGA